MLLHGVRLLRQPGAIVAGLSLVVAASLSYLGGGSGECSAGKAPGAFGAFVCYAPAPFVFLVPAAAALVGGVLVASSRARGEDVVYAVRGLAGTRLTLARVLAGSFAAGSVVLLAGLVLVALALVLLPHRPELDRPPGVGVIPGFRPPEPGLPLPVLWRDAPLVGDLLAAVVYALAAAALAALGNAVGQLLAQPVAAFAAPVLLVLATQVAPLPGLGRWISGYAYLDLMPIHGTMTDLPGALRLPAILAYWLALLVAAVALALAAARRQEARA